MIARPMLRFAAACAALGLAAMAGAAVAACPDGAPVGVFKGSYGGEGGERIEVTLNLVCAEARYVAQFFTSQSDFQASEATGGPGRVNLKFEDQPFGNVELKLDGDSLSGAFGIGSGGLSLVRAGPPLALDALRPTLTLTTAQWREDLAAFAAELPKRHANAFFHQPKPIFEAEVARLDRRLAALNGDEIFVNLQRIANAVGDGHTGVNMPPDRQTLPIEIGRFGTDLRIVAAGPGLEKALGARIVAIGRLPVAQAWRRAMTLTPQDELPELREGRAAVYLARGVLLHGLGITPQRTHAVFALRDDAGRTFKLDIAGLAPGATVPMTTTASGKGLAERNPGKPFWCQDLTDRRAVYCAFHAYQSLGRGALDMFALVDKAHPDKLIVDMRDNGGGDNTLGYAFLVRPLIGRADLNRKGRLYVLVSALTFSAAMNNAAQFQDQTNAILVGQEIGEKPNSYQEPRQFRLPNSHLIVRASSLYYKFREHGPNAVAPDKSIIPTWADVKAGRDPVLDWVLAQPAP